MVHPEAGPVACDWILVAFGRLLNMILIKLSFRAACGHAALFL